MKLLNGKCYKITDFKNIKGQIDENEYQIVKYYHIGILMSPNDYAYKRMRSDFSLLGGINFKYVEITYATPNESKKFHEESNKILRQLRKGVKPRINHTTIQDKNRVYKF